jgi:hypothetical protein
MRQVKINLPNQAMPEYFPEFIEHQELGMGRIKPEPIMISLREIQEVDPLCLRPPLDWLLEETNSELIETETENEKTN